MRPNAYEDRCSVPRGGQTNSQLPSPRKITVEAITTIDSVSEWVNFRFAILFWINSLQHIKSLSLFISRSNTALLMNFGQFIDHDLAETPVHDCGDENRTVIQCCQETKCPTYDCKQFLFW